MFALGTAVAFANAPNPLTGTTGTETTNSDGTVTVNLNGTWSWGAAAGLSPQACSGRYGMAWSVDWWGVSTSKTPTNNFSLTNASEITAVTQGQGGTSPSTGTITSAGSWQLKPPPPSPGSPPPANQFFHVAQFYSGQQIFTTAFCTNNSNGPSGSWTATATYPSASDIPPQICVNMYDVHGTQGKPSSFTSNDYMPVKNGDNSIQTNAFNPTNGGYCVASSNLKKLIVFVGYADSYRPAGSGIQNPTPWMGSSGVTFVGAQDVDHNFDGGALRFDNPTSSTIFISSVSVTIGNCTFDPWTGSGTLSVAPGKTLILTQTGKNGPAGPWGVGTCQTVSKPDVVGENFDTSETVPKGTSGCTPDGLIPSITFTAGTKMTLSDTTQVLNSGGKDMGDPACGAGNESHQWVQLP